MNKSSFYLTILSWVEMILAVRILLFAVPVLIARNTAGGMSAWQVNDWFMVVVAIVSLLYFSVGLATVLKHKLWRVFHYGALLVVFVLTAGLFKRMAEFETAVQTAYYLPVGFALLVTVLTLVVGPKTTLQPKQDGE